MSKFINIVYNNQWTGYKNFGDIANMSISDMAPGSQNVFIQDGKKLEVRAGMDYLGAEGVEVPNIDPIANNWTIAGRIHSAYDDFVNNQGTKIPLRVYWSGQNAIGDVIQAWLPVYTNTIFFNPLSVTGTFIVGEFVQGGTSLSLARVVSFSLASNELVLEPSGAFIPGETVTGISSGATLIVGTFTVNTGTTASKWQPLSEGPFVSTSPIIPQHRYYWAEWYDPLNKQNRVVFTNGAYGGGTNFVYSWTGGYANVVAITPTTITTDTTWQEKGFISAPEGVDAVIIQGIRHNLTAGNFSTNTITVASTAGVLIGDIAFQAVNTTDIMPVGYTADVCSMVKNQVYYEDWRTRELLGSWNRNEVSHIDLSVYVGSSGLNDAVFTIPAGYTGLIDKDFKVTIDSVNPPETIFTGTGANGLVFDMSGYTQTGTTNTYRVVVFKIPNTVQASQNSIQYDVSTASAAFIQGETIIGGTSGATQTVVWDDQVGSLLLAFDLAGGPFTSGETITGGTTGSTAVVTAYRIDPNSYRLFSYKVYKNDVEIAVVSPQLTDPLGAPNPGPFIVTDGITFSIPLDIIGTLSPTFTLDDFIFYNGSLVDGDTWQITLTSTVDTFTWSLNGDAQATHVDTSLGAIPLTDGVFVTFFQTHGHAIGDTWTTSAHPTITRGWREFYFATPIRLPGQGFKVTLDSNGWTMKPQEEVMYVNAQAGHYYTIQLQLSADLKSETVQVTRLKSEPQNKVLFPYLINYVKNYLSTISQDKTYDILGRQKFLEFPQSKSISDEIRYDFETADWEDGDVLYIKRKIYFTIPKEGKVLIWDDFRKYWHAPMRFGRRVGLISVIDNKLIGHSYERNESYELFVGTNDLGIFPIETRMTFAYNGFGQRYGQKASSAIGMEGYIEGNPAITWQVNFGVGGCDGTPNGKVAPIFCIPKDTASLGKSGLGFHGLGNDPVTPSPFFNYIKPFPNVSFYLRNIELTCNTLDQRWSIISIGTDVQNNNLSNDSITDNVL